MKYPHPEAVDLWNTETTKLEYWMKENDGEADIVDALISSLPIMEGWGYVTIKEI